MNCYENIPKASEGNPGFRDHAWTEDNQGAGILSRGTLGPLHRDAGEIALSEGSRLDRRQPGGGNTEQRHTGPTTQRCRGNSSIRGIPPGQETTRGREY